MAKASLLIELEYDVESGHAVEQVLEDFAYENGFELEDDGLGVATLKRADPTFEFIASIADSLPILLDDLSSAEADTSEAAEDQDESGRDDYGESDDLSELDE